MQVIVAGGSGFIGRELIKQLVAKGHQVWVLSRTPSKVKLPQGATVIGWDGRTPQGWQPLVETADAIVNLAGENLSDGRWTPERIQRILSSRVDAGNAISEAVKASNHKPAVVLQASAIGFYGAADDRVLDENSPAGTDELAKICLDWEGSTQPVEDLGVRRCVLRIGLVLNSRGGVLDRLKLPFQLFVGGPLGSGKQWYTWIHMADLIGAIIFLLQHPTASGVFNLTSPAPVTNAEFGRTLGRALHRPYWLPVPAFALRFILGKMSTLVLNGQRVIPARLQEFGYAYQYATLLPALEDLIG